MYTRRDLVLPERFAHIVALNTQHAGGSTDSAVNGSSGNGTVNLTMGFAVLAVSGFILFRRDKRLQSTPERAIALMIQGELDVVNSLYYNIAGKY